MSRRIAVLGLSGVGKSTLIARIRETLPLMHLQASELIKAEQAHRATNPDSSEALRTGAVIDNQVLLIAAFQREAEATDLPIVFDGHSVIDGHEGLIEIPSSVFSALRLDAICFLADDPSVIADRRRTDLNRERPYREIATLRRHQDVSEATARRIATEVKLPFYYITGPNIQQLREIIRQQ